MNCHPDEMELDRSKPKEWNTRVLADFLRFGVFCSDAKQLKMTIPLQYRCLFSFLPFL